MRSAHLRRENIMINNMEKIKSSFIHKWKYILALMLTNLLFILAIYQSAFLSMGSICLLLLITIPVIIIPLVFDNKIISDMGVLLLAAVYSYIYIEAYTVMIISYRYNITRFFNILAYFLIILFIYTITKRKLIAILITQIFWIIVGFISFLLLKFRGNPLFLSDIESIRTAVNVVGEYNIEFNIWIVIEIAVMLFNPLVMCHLLGKSKGLQLKLKNQIISLVLIIIASVCLYNQGFIKSVGITPVWIKHTVNNGFLVNTIVQAQNYGTQKPVDYSVEKVENIKKENTATMSKGEDKPDIICIMNESFSDLRVINDFDTNKEYMPYFNSLKNDANCITGNLYVSVKGGNTANTEYEFLSGDTMSFYNNMVPFNAYVKKEMPTNVTALENQGYSTLGFHPWDSTGWCRNVVYKWLGFDKSYFIEDLDESKIDKIRNYPSDSFDYKQLNEYYNSMPETPRFLFNVTMQNHGGYDAEDFDSSIYLEGSDKEVYPKTNQYLTLMKHSDDAIKELLEYYKNSDRKVIICFWGDHQPGVEDEFIEKLYGKKSDDLTQEELERRYAVPFFIWANYDIPKENIDKMSTNYLFPYLFKLAGLELTPFQNYLLKLREKYPVISGVGAIDSSGKYYTIEETHKLDHIQEYYNVINNRMFDSENMVDDFFD